MQGAPIRAKYKSAHQCQGTPRRRGFTWKSTVVGDRHTHPVQADFSPCWRIHHNTSTTRLVVYHRFGQEGYGAHWLSAGLLEYKYKLYLYICLVRNLCIGEQLNISTKIIHVKVLCVQISTNILHNSAQSPQMLSVWTTRTPVLP